MYIPHNLFLLCGIYTDVLACVYSQVWRPEVDSEYILLYCAPLNITFSLSIH